MGPRANNLIVYSLVSFIIIVALFIFWAGWLNLNYPHDGFNWYSQSGEIETVDGNGPVSGLIETGDRVIAIDDRFIPIIDSLYFDKRPGDVVIMTVQRQESVVSLPVVLSIPPWNVRLSRFLPIIVAFGFWVAGTYVFSYQPRDQKSRLFLLVCLCSGLALAAGSISVISPEFVRRLFSVSLYWLVPLIVSFHMVFPKPNYYPSIRYFNYFLFCVAIIMSLYQILVISIERSLDYFQSALYMFHRMWLTTGLLVVVFLLIMAYRSENSDVTRRQVGIITLGGGLAVLMFLGLALIPDIFHGKPLLLYNFSFVFILLIPLSYIHAITQFHLIPIDRYVNRTISSILTMVLLLGIFLLTAIALVRIVPEEAWLEPLALLVIMMGIVLLGVPLKRGVESLVEHLFYGRTYDYRSTIQNVSQLMQEQLNDTDFGRVLLRELVTTMQLECACIHLSNGENRFTADGFAYENCRRISSEKGGLIHNFQTSDGFSGRREPLPLKVLHQEADDILKFLSEEKLPTCDQAKLLIPVHGSRGSMGFILTGSKTGKGEISKDEEGVLQIIARLAGIALENINLASENKQRNLECVHLNHQILRAGETERKRLAWELHDQIIQSLTGAGYGLAELRYKLDQEEQSGLNTIQENIFEVVNDLRRICTDLRPPLLDTLGLVAAIRSLVRNFSRGSEYRVILEVDGEEEVELTEEIEMSIYRILQEILHNAQKYSQARLVQVKLALEPERVFLRVEDDGEGFVIPENLSQFGVKGHFGLMGIKERVEMLDGTLKVISAPKRGSQITIEIPTTLKQDKNTI
jgi:signal transduction histidine kinase